jgi:hypothetical protein
MAVLGVPVCLLGVLEAGLGNVLGAAIGTGSCVLVTCVALHSLGDGRPSWSQTLRWTCWGTLVAVGLVAAVSAVGSPGLFAAVLLAASSPAARERLRQRGKTRRLRELTDAQLCLAWQLSSRHLSVAPLHQRLGVVQLRASYLDEVERRSPSGLRAWMESRGRDDQLESFLISHRGSGHTEAPDEER